MQRDCNDPSRTTGGSTWTYEGTVSGNRGKVKPSVRGTVRRYAGDGVDNWSPLPKRDSSRAGWSSRMTRVGTRLRQGAIKKGGVDLSAFHATQGRRIVDISTTPVCPAGS